MLRLVALAWEPRCEDQTIFASGLRRRIERELSLRIVFDAPGLSVFCAGLRPASTRVQSIGGRGVLLGTLFRRSDIDGELTPSQASIEATESEALLADGGACLSHRFWGRYIAFVRDAERRTTWVFQNPSGGWPVYRAKASGLWLYFSELRDFARLSERPLSISWDYIAAHAVVPVLYTEATGIDGIQELLGGQCDRINDCGLATLTRWSPATFTASILDDPDCAAKELHRIVDYCTRAWASCYPNLLHQLSGGFDSSALASCLVRAADTDVSFVHYHSVGVGSDELCYAQMIAESAGRPLMVRPGDAIISFEDFEHITPSPRPSSYLPCAVERTSAELARMLGATGICTGQLGDAVFYQSRDHRIAVDYVHNNGITRKLPSVVKQAAALSKVAGGRIAIEALTGLTRRYPETNLMLEAIRYRKLLTRAVIDATRTGGRFAHPWVRAAAGVPPAKARQIAMMASALPARVAMSQADDAEYVHPLGSQPILELCSAIPTYTLTYGAIPRGLARIAFGGNLPDTVLKRRLKSRASAYIDKLVEHNRALLKVWLVDGELVRRGIVESQPLVDVLAGKPTTVDPGELQFLASLTAWVNVINGCNRTYRAAA
jgi:asparagine synthase (glutamine-hydrolysing)